jgi:hypothetical protein
VDCDSVISTVVRSVVRIGRFPLDGGQVSSAEAASGRIEKLSSGSLRVSVYAGADPITKRRAYLRETIPGGPKAHAEAEKAQTRLLNQVDEKRHPRTSATVGQLLDRYLDVLDVAANTKVTFASTSGHGDSRPFIPASFHGLRLSSNCQANRPRSSSRPRTPHFR